MSNMYKYEREYALAGAIGEYLKKVRKELGITHSTLGEHLAPSWGIAKPTAMVYLSDLEVGPMIAFAACPELRGSRHWQEISQRLSDYMKSMPLSEEETQMIAEVLKRINPEFVLPTPRVQIIPQFPARKINLETLEKIVQLEKP